MYPIGKRFQPFNMPSAHYNLDYLQQVFQGNDAMVHRILDSFEEQVPAYFAEMDKRWHEGRWQDIHPLAHKAKSSIGMLGMTALLEHVVHFLLVKLAITVLIGSIEELSCDVLLHNGT